MCFSWEQQLSGLRDVLFESMLLLWELLPVFEEVCSWRFILESIPDHVHTECRRLNHVQQSLSDNFSANPHESNSFNDHEACFHLSEAIGERIIYWWTGNSRRNSKMSNLFSYNNGNMSKTSIWVIRCVGPSLSYPTVIFPYWTISRRPDWKKW